MWDWGVNMCVCVCMFKHRKSKNKKQMYQKNGIAPWTTTVVLPKCTKNNIHSLWEGIKEKKNSTSVSKFQNRCFVVLQIIQYQCIKLCTSWQPLHLSLQLKTIVLYVIHSSLFIPPKRLNFSQNFRVLIFFFYLWFYFKNFKSFKRNNLSRLSVVHCLQYSEIDIIRLKYF